MMSLGLNKLDLGIHSLAATDILGEEGEPIPIVDEHVSLEDIRIVIDPSTGDLVSVEDLNTEPLVAEDGTVPEVIPSTERMTSLVQADASARPSSRENIAIHRIHTSVGLEFLGEIPKPPPAIFVDIENRVVRAHLNGVCYTTVAPLLHLLVNAEAEDTFIIEINSPMLRLEDIVSVISAIDETAAKTRTILSAACQIPTLILGISGTEFDLLPSVHIFAPLTSFAVGSADEIALGGEQFKRYSELVMSYLVDRKVLTPEEAVSLQNDSVIFTLTSEEIESRMGITNDLTPIDMNAPLLPKPKESDQDPSE